VSKYFTTLLENKQIEIIATVPGKKPTTKLKIYDHTFRHSDFSAKTPPTTDPQANQPAISADAKKPPAQGLPPVATPAAAAAPELPISKNRANEEMFREVILKKLKETKRPQSFSQTKMKTMMLAAEKVTKLVKLARSDDLTDKRLEAMEKDKLIVGSPRNKTAAAKKRPRYFDKVYRLRSPEDDKPTKRSKPQKNAGRAGVKKLAKKSAAKNARTKKNKKRK
jgi:hypothetical protein